MVTIIVTSVATMIVTSIATMVVTTIMTTGHSQQFLLSKFHTLDLCITRLFTIESKSKHNILLWRNVCRVSPFLKKSQ